MIERNGSGRMITCELCSEHLEEFDKDDFSEMVANAKGEGWEIKQTPDGWEHRCPSCKSESTIDRQRRIFGL